jgi:hypothetical protein
MEDDRLLNAGPDGNFRNALVFRMGEKKILHYFVDLCTLGLALLCSEWESEQDDEEQYLPPLSRPVSCPSLPSLPMLPPLSPPLPPSLSSCRAKLQHIMTTGSVDGILAPFDASACASADALRQQQAKRSTLTSSTSRSSPREQSSASSSSSDTDSRPSSSVAGGQASVTFACSLSCPPHLSLLLQDLASIVSPKSSSRADASNHGLHAQGILNYFTAVVVPLQQHRHRSKILAQQHMQASERAEK